MNSQKCSITCYIKLLWIYYVCRTKLSEILRCEAADQHLIAYESSLCWIRIRIAIQTISLSIEKELLTTLSSVYHFPLQSHVHFKHFFSFPHVFFLFSRYWDLTNIFNYSLHRRRKLQIKFKRYERRYDPSLEPVYLLDSFHFKSFFRNRY